MKVLGVLVVLAAGFVGVSSGPAHAMPVKLSFSGTVLDPSECGTVNGNCIPEFFEPSQGGIFAPGQSVVGSFVYDPGSLTSTSVNPNGSVGYSNTTRDLMVSIASNVGSYSVDFTGAVNSGSNRSFVCGVPTCLLSTGEQFYSLLDSSSVAPPPGVAGSALLAGGITFLNDKNLLSSSALLPAEELLSVIQQSRQFVALLFVGGDKCPVENICYVVAEVSVSVPEPATVSLLGIGLVGMIALRRRKRIAS